MPNLISQAAVGADTSRLAQCVARLAETLEAGHPVDLDELCADCPEAREQLEMLLPTLQAVVEFEHNFAEVAASPRNPNQPVAESLRDSNSPHADGSPRESHAFHVEEAPGALSGRHPAPGLLGDFRILRELGRGGMGVVYEAEQLSLGRRVALKVLPFAAMLDRQQLARFKNEARAAATLDHPNIVAIHSVGVERGVHYYAMQLIEGMSLAQLIEEQKAKQKQSGVRGQEAAAETADHPAARAGALLAPSPRRGGLGRGGDLGATVAHQASSIKHPASAPDTQPVAALSTLPDFNSRDYYRTVARLGIQAAEALDHAHQNGVLHRDVKPANLLVDEAGKLWITDFGLARIEQDAGLTMTGDLLGTLRYMSPEQALAKRVVVDHRSDIYSLGATLYELLTLQPTFKGDDRQELLRQIAFDEPQKLRQINPRLPQDLETIVLKAIEKNPADRYASAQQLADDLRRFLDERPIRARPQSLMATARKWARRNRTVMWASTIAFAVCALVASASIGWAIRDKLTRQAVANAAATTALDEAARLVKQEKWPEALTAAKRADDLLVGAGIGGPVARRAKEFLKDANMVLQLDELSLDGDVDDRARNQRYLDAERNYSQVFRDYGIDVESLDVNVAAEQIRSRAIRLELASALDNWATWRRGTIESVAPDKLGKPLIDLARLVDSDPWRNRLRDALMGRTTADRKAALAALEAPAKKQALPLRTTLNLAGLFGRYGDAARAIELLRAAQHEHADDFRVNARLANLLATTKPRQYEEAIRFYTAACALRPDSGLTHLNLGYALAESNRIEEARRHFERAVALRPDSHVSQHNLATCLYKAGRLEEAQAHFEEALRLKPDFAEAHNGLAGIYADHGNVAAALASQRKAVQLLPSHAELHANLGRTLLKNGVPDEAVESFREAVRLSPETAVMHYCLGLALYRSGHSDQAIPSFEEAVRIEPTSATYHDNLAVMLAETGAMDKALSHWQEALRLWPDHSVFHSNFGFALWSNREYEDAAQHFEEAIRLAPDEFPAYRNLASLLATSPVDEVRDGQRALQLATKACELTDYKNLDCVHALAAAYAEVGDFKAAVKWAEKAVELSQPNPPESLERLESYRGQKPWRKLPP